MLKKQEELNIFKKGFTLIETLVAISILLLGVVAPLALASDSLKAARLARDQVIATYLAQEGIEYVRWVRDTNMIEGDSWIDGLENCLDPDGCMVDAVRRRVAPATSNCLEGDCILLLNDNSYEHGSGTPTPFARRVRLIPVVYLDDLHDYQVEVTMTWDTAPFGTRSLVVREYIFSWR